MSRRASAILGDGAESSIHRVVLNRLKAIRTVGGFLCIACAENFDRREKWGR